VYTSNPSPFIESASTPHTKPFHFKGFLALFAVQSRLAGISFSVPKTDHAEGTPESFFMYMVILLLIRSIAHLNLYHETPSKVYA
jgi:hypothetical protein